MIKLTCKISNTSRPTSQRYLEAKAERLGVSVSWLRNNYISKSVCSQLRKGVNVSELGTWTGTDTELKDLVTRNSKSRVAFKFVDGTYVAVGEKPKAPRVVTVQPDQSTLEALVADAVQEKEEVVEEVEEAVQETADEALEALVAAATEPNKVAFNIK